MVAKSMTFNTNVREFDFRSLSVVFNKTVLGKCDHLLKECL